MVKTKWYPDTCDCVIEYEGDFHSPISVSTLKRCKLPDHANASQGNPHFLEMKKHNKKPAWADKSTDNLNDSRNKRQARLTEKERIRNL